MGTASHKKSENKSFLCFEIKINHPTDDDCGIMTAFLPNGFPVKSEEYNSNKDYLKFLITLSWLWMMKYSENEYVEKGVADLMTANLFGYETDEIKRKLVKDVAQTYNTKWDTMQMMFGDGVIMVGGMNILGGIGEYGSI